MANLTQTYVEVARALVVPNAITLTHSYVEVARSRDRIRKCSKYAVGD